MGQEKILRNLRTLNWVILLVLASASYTMMNQDFTMGITLGGLMIIANFGVLQHTIHGAFSSDGGLLIKKGGIIAKYYLRLAAMGILIYVLITRQWVHPVGLTIGLSVVVISIVSLGIHMGCKTSS